MLAAFDVFDFFRETHLQTLAKRFAPAENGSDEDNTLHLTLCCITFYDNRKDVVEAFYP